MGEYRKEKQLGRIGKKQLIWQEYLLWNMLKHKNINEILKYIVSGIKLSLALYCDHLLGHIIKFILIKIGHQIKIGIK